MRLPRLTTITLGIIAVLCLFLILSPSQERRMPTLNTTNPRLAFTCSHEQDHLPPLAPQADLLYRHGRWLERNNLLEQKADVYPQIERYYRIATAHGHYRANLRLRDMIARGLAASDDPVKETVDLVQELIDRGIPGGYYDMGQLLETGYGVKEDSELALQYFRKAADLGSPEGQYWVAEKLAPINMAPEVARAMRRCAAEQGHGEAALALGLDLQGNQNFKDAISTLQMGAQAGNSTSAGFLEEGFKTPKPDGGMYYMALTPDPERSRRYEAISKMLSDWDYLNPSVPEIDSIVPLPPAPLPPWDGSFQWLKAQLANQAPPLPSEETIRRMAVDKQLDPATGRPDPQAQQALRAQQAAEARFTPPHPDATPLGTICHSGERCPHSGLWQPLLPVASQHTTLAVWLHDRQPQNLALDQLFPAGQVARQRSNRLLQNLRGPVLSTEAIRWQLLSYW